MRPEEPIMIEQADFDDIFRQHYSWLYFYVRQFVADAEACRDVVSSVFESLWIHRGSVEPGAVRSWLFVNAKNKSLDYLRHERHQRAYADFCRHALMDYGEDGDPLELQDRWRYIGQVIEGLQPPTRDIFMACYVEGKKYSEVAEEMGISVATVKKHIVRALRLLRERHKKRK